MKLKILILLFLVSFSLEENLQNETRSKRLASLDLSVSNVLTKFTNLMDSMGLDSSAPKLLNNLYNSTFSKDNLLFKRRLLNFIIRSSNFMLRYLPEEPVQENPQLYKLSSKFITKYTGRNNERSTLRPYFTQKPIHIDLPTYSPNIEETTKISENANNLEATTISVAKRVENEISNEVLNTLETVDLELEASKNVEVYYHFPPSSEVEVNTRPYSPYYVDHKPPRETYTNRNLKKNYFVGFNIGHQGDEEYDDYEDYDQSETTRRRRSVVGEDNLEALEEDEEMMKSSINKLKTNLLKLDEDLAGKDFMSDENENVIEQFMAMLEILTENLERSGNVVKQLLLRLDDLNPKEEMKMETVKEVMSRLMPMKDLIEEEDNLKGESGKVLDDLMMNWEKMEENLKKMEGEDGRKEVVDVEELQEDKDLKEVVGEVDVEVVTVLPSKIVDEVPSVLPEVEDTSMKNIINKLMMKLNTMSVKNVGGGKNVTDSKKGDEDVKGGGVRNGSEVEVGVVWSRNGGEMSEDMKIGTTESSIIGDDVSEENAEETSEDVKVFNSLSEVSGSERKGKQTNAAILTTTTTRISVSPSTTTTSPSTTTTSPSPTTTSTKTNPTTITTSPSTTTTTTVPTHPTTRMVTTTISATTSSIPITSSPETTTTSPTTNNLPETTKTTITTTNLPHTENEILSTAASTEKEIEVTTIPPSTNAEVTTTVETITIPKEKITEVTTSKTKLLDETTKKQETSFTTVDSITTESSNKVTTKVTTENNLTTRKDSVEDIATTIPVTTAIPETVTTTAKTVTTSAAPITSTTAPATTTVISETTTANLVTTTVPIVTTRATKAEDITTLAGVSTSLLVEEEVATAIREKDSRSLVFNNISAEAATMITPVPVTTTPSAVTEKETTPPVTTTSVTTPVREVVTTVTTVTPPKVTTVAPDVTTITPVVTTSRSAMTTVVPAITTSSIVTTVVPDVTTEASVAVTDTPVVTTISPVTTVPSVITSVTSIDTTVVPVITTDSPVVTTVPQVVTTDTPVVTTDPPVVTTVSSTVTPVETTVVPVVTTVPPAVATVVPVITTIPPVVTTVPPIVTFNQTVVTTDLPVITTDPSVVTTVPPVVTTVTPAVTTIPSVVTTAVEEMSTTESPKTIISSTSPTSNGTATTVTPIVTTATPVVTTSNRLVKTAKQLSPLVQIVMPESSTTVESITMTTRPMSTPEVTTTTLPVTTTTLDPSLTSSSISDATVKPIVITLAELTKTVTTEVSEFVKPTTSTVPTPAVITTLLPVTTIVSDSHNESATSVTLVTAVPTTLRSIVTTSSVPVTTSSVPVTTFSPPVTTFASEMSTTTDFVKTTTSSVTTRGVTPTAHDSSNDTITTVIPVTPPVTTVMSVTPLVTTVTLPVTTVAEVTPVVTTTKPLPVTESVSNSSNDTVTTVTPVTSSSTVVTTITPIETTSKPIATTESLITATPSVTTPNDTSNNLIAAVTTVSPNVTTVTPMDSTLTPIVTTVKSVVTNGSPVRTAKKLSDTSSTESLTTNSQSVTTPGDVPTIVIDSSNDTVTTVTTDEAVVTTAESVASTVTPVITTIAPVETTVKLISTTLSPPVKTTITSDHSVTTEPVKTTTSSVTTEGSLPITKTVTDTITTITPIVTNSTTDVTTVTPIDTTLPSTEKTTGPITTTDQFVTTITTPIVTAVTPHATTATPDITTVITTVKPIETTVKPIDITVKPIEITVKPIETTVKPIETTVKPIVTTISPPVTPVKAEISTAAEPITIATSSVTTEATLATLPATTTTPQPSKDSVTTVTPITETVTTDVTMVTHVITTVTPAITTVTPDITTVTSAVTTHNPTVTPAVTTAIPTVITAKSVTTVTTLLSPIVTVTESVTTPVSSKDTKQSDTANPIIVSVTKTVTSSTNSSSSSAAAILDTEIGNAKLVTTNPLDKSGKVTADKIEVTTSNSILTTIITGKAKVVSSAEDGVLEKEESEASLVSPEKLESLSLIRSNAKLNEGDKKVDDEKEERKAKRLEDVKKEEEGRVRSNGKFNEAMKNVTRKSDDDENKEEDLKKEGEARIISHGKFDEDSKNLDDEKEEEGNGEDAEKEEMRNEKEIRVSEEGKKDNNISNGEKMGRRKGKKIEQDEELEKSSISKVSVHEKKKSEEEEEIEYYGDDDEENDEDSDEDFEEIEEKAGETSDEEIGVSKDYIYVDEDVEEDEDKTKDFEDVSEKEEATTVPSNSLRRPFKFFNILSRSKNPKIDQTRKPLTTVNAPTKSLPGIKFPPRALNKLRTNSHKLNTIPRFPAVVRPTIAPAVTEAVVQRKKSKRKKKKKKAGPKVVWSIVKKEDFKNETVVMNNVIKNINNTGKFIVLANATDPQKFVYVVVQKSLIRIPDARRKRDLSTSYFSDVLQRFKQISPNLQGFSSSGNYQGPPRTIPCDTNGQNLRRNGVYGTAPERPKTYGPPVNEYKNRWENFNFNRPQNHHQVTSNEEPSSTTASSADTETANFNVLPHFHTKNVFKQAEETSFKNLPLFDPPSTFNPSVEEILTMMRDMHRSSKGFIILPNVEMLKMFKSTEELEYSGFNLLPFFDLKNVFLSETEGGKLKKIGRENYILPNRMMLLPFNPSLGFQVNMKTPMSDSLGGHSKASEAISSIKINLKQFGTKFKDEDFEEKVKKIREAFKEKKKVMLGLKKVKTEEEFEEYSGFNALPYFDRKAKFLGNLKGLVKENEEENFEDKKKQMKIDENGKVGLNSFKDKKSGFSMKFDESEEEEDIEDVKTSTSTSEEKVDAVEDVEFGQYDGFNNVPHFFKEETFFSNNDLEDKEDGVGVFQFNEDKVVKTENAGKNKRMKIEKSLNVFGKGEDVENEETSSNFNGNLGVDGTNWTVKDFEDSIKDFVKNFGGNNGKHVDGNEENAVGKNTIDLSNMKIEDVKYEGFNILPHFEKNEQFLKKEGIGKFEANDIGLALINGKVVSVSEKEEIVGEGDGKNTEFSKNEEIPKFEVSDVGLANGEVVSVAEKEDLAVNEEARLSNQKFKQFKFTQNLETTAKPKFEANNEESPKTNEEFPDYTGFNILPHFEKKTNFAAIKDIIINDLLTQDFHKITNEEQNRFKLIKDFQNMDEETKKSFLKFATGFGNTRPFFVSQGSVNPGRKQEEKIEESKGVVVRNMQDFDEIAKIFNIPQFQNLKNVGMEKPWFFMKIPTIDVRTIFSGEKEEKPVFKAEQDKRVFANRGDVAEEVEEQSGEENKIVEEKPNLDSVLKKQQKLFDLIKSKIGGEVKFESRFGEEEDVGNGERIVFLENEEAKAEDKGGFKRVGEGVGGQSLVFFDPSTAQDTNLKKVEDGLTQGDFFPAETTTRSEQPNNKQSLNAHYDTLVKMLGVAENPTTSTNSLTTTLTNSLTTTSTNSLTTTTTNSPINSKLFVFPEEVHPQIRSNPAQIPPFGFPARPKPLNLQNPESVSEIFRQRFESLGPGEAMKVQAKNDDETGEPMLFLSTVYMKPDGFSPDFPDFGKRLQPKV